MAQNSDVLSFLRKELKEWEHNFISSQNRSPTKHDIKSNPSVQYKYKQYSKLKKRQREEKLQQTPRSTHTNVESVRSPITATKHQPAIVEIGPTPQIFGKSISIFELNLSPVKKRLQIPKDHVEENTREIEIQETEPESDASDSPFNEQSPNMDAFTAPRTKSTLEVPKSKNYGPNSPLKLPYDLSVALKLRTPVKNPNFTDSDIDSLVTPPIWKRNITKSLKDLENEYLEVSRTFTPLDDITLGDKSVSEKNVNKDTESTEDHTDMINELSKIKKRRIRIRRFEDTSRVDNAQPKINLHKQLHKLKKKQLKKFMNDLEIEDDTIISDEADTDNEKETATKVNPVKKPRKKKYNLVSNNFKRLKLPTKKRNNFTKRFHSRRY